MKYDAFISYSRKADGRLAPDIQLASKKLTKPWYKLSALNIFRDQTDLGASPHLWTSIVDALGNSRYFILMASPEAAKSKWVVKEVEYWIQNKSIDTLLIVLSAGKIVWDEDKKDFNKDSTDAIPACLYGQYTEEPAYIEFGKVWNTKEYNLNDPGFISAIAEIAAPIHRKTVGELIGKDIQEYNRTIRYRNGAIITLLLLLASSIALAATAYNSYLNASKSELVAKNERDKAKVSEQRAEKEATKANKNLLLANARLDSIENAKKETSVQVQKTLFANNLYNAQYQSAKELSNEFIYAVEAMPFLASYATDTSFKVYKGSITIFNEIGKYNLSIKQELLLDKFISDWKRSENRPRIVIEGYSTNNQINEDNFQIVKLTGKSTKQYNLMLSSKRASLCAQYMIANGIEASKIACIGMGDNAPISKGVLFNDRIEIFTE